MNSLTSPAMSSPVTGAQMIGLIQRPHLSFDMGAFNSYLLQPHIRRANYPTDSIPPNISHPFDDFLLKMHMGRGPISKVRHIMWNRALASEERSRAKIRDFLSAGNVEKAGKEQLRLGGKIWGHSKIFGAGRWSEAERMYILGAMMMMRQMPLAGPGDPEVINKASGLLLAKGILSENTRGLGGESRQFVFSDPVGMGSRVTVRKIYGRDEVLKTYDGGYVRFISSPDKSFAIMHQIQILKDSPTLANRQRGGFASLEAMGISVPVVFEQGRDYLVSELIEGILLKRVSSILGQEELSIAASALASYLSAIAMSGVGIDANLGPNLIYRWDRSWRLIDL